MSLAVKLGAGDAGDLDAGTERSSSSSEGGGARLDDSRWHRVVVKRRAAEVSWGRTNCRLRYFQALAALRMKIEGRA